MRYLLIFVSVFFFSSSSNSDVTNQIINNLEKTKSYSFEFIQKINESKETGNCILVFDRKINCIYENTGKILISDGKNLVIKTRNSNIPNFYKLENTYFYKILEKKYLINELSKSRVKKGFGKLYVDVNYQNINIKIYFDKERLYLKGWKTKDIYDNSVLTDINIQEVNKTVNENIFDVQKLN